MLPGVAIDIDHRIDLYNLNSLLFKIFRLWAITSSKGTCLTSGFLWIDFSADFQNLLWLLCHGAESKAHLGGWEEASRQQCLGNWAFSYFCYRFPYGKLSAGPLHTPLATRQQQSVVCRRDCALTHDIRLQKKILRGPGQGDYTRSRKQLLTPPLLLACVWQGRSASLPVRDIHPSKDIISQ